MGSHIGPELGLSPPPPGHPSGDGEVGEVGYSWRRMGEPLYASLAFIVFVCEGAALGFLTWALLFSRGVSKTVTLGIQNLLVGAVTITAVALAIVTGSVVLFSASSSRRERHRRDEIAAWTSIWQRVVAGEVACPEGPLPSTGIAGLLECREQAVGAEAEQIRILLSRTGVDRYLGDKLLELGGIRSQRWVLHAPGGSQRLGAALDLLDDAARARVPLAVSPLLALVGRPEPAIQTMALRAVSRTIAAMPPGPERVTAVMALLRRLESHPIARTALDRTLLLLEDSAAPLIAVVLRDQDKDPILISSCLDSAGRLGLTELAPAVCPYLRPAEPVEVRAAALRALAALATLPPSAIADLRAALSDTEDIVRTQAARAAYLLPAHEAIPALEALLGDQAWWVRRAAGNSLRRIPTLGTDALERAARDHPDHFARDMAAQVLRDDHVLSPTTSPLVRGTA